MDSSTKANGKIIKCTELESNNIQVENSTKVNFPKAKKKATANMFPKMVTNTLENGKMVFSTVKENI